MAGAPQAGTLRVVGYQELLRALKLAEKADRLAVRKVLRSVGEDVQRDAVQDVSPVDSRTAGGYRVYVRQRGVGVEQSLRKTTGLHPEWGSWQMRHALVPALEANEDSTERKMEEALSLVSDRFNAGGIVV